MTFFDAPLIDESEAPRYVYRFSTFSSSPATLPPPVPAAAYALLAGVGGGGACAADDPAFLRAVADAAAAPPFSSPSSSSLPASSAPALRSIELTADDARNEHAIVLSGTPVSLDLDDENSGSSSGTLPVPVAAVDAGLAARSPSAAAAHTAVFGPATAAASAPPLAFAAGAPVAEWECAVCTLINDAHALECAACATRFPCAAAEA